MLTVGSRGVDWGLAAALVVYLCLIEAGGDVDWGLTCVVFVWGELLSRRVSKMSKFIRDIWLTGVVMLYWTYK